MRDSRTATLIRLAAILAFMTAAPALWGTQLTAETDRPEMSTYAVGEAVNIHIRAAEIPADAADLLLRLRVLDVHDTPVTEAELAIVPDGDKAWETTWEAPTPRLGFYRVLLELSDGTTTPARGSRPAGMLTYIVVPDPAERRLFPPERSRFGMMLGFNCGVNVVPYLGVRWVIGGFYWRHLEPDRPGQLRDAVTAARERGEPFSVKNERADFYSVTRNGQPERWTLYPVPSPYFGYARAGRREWYGPRAGRWFLDRHCPGPRPPRPSRPTDRTTSGGHDRYPSPRHRAGRNGARRNVRRATAGAWTR